MDARETASEGAGANPLLAWRKSSASGSGGCVEVAATASEIFIRDSKNRSGAVLRFTNVEWLAFLAGVRGGEFDLGLAP
ncbi:DUF397 domain-containing protein [Pseudofrankia inefficax]|uniref:DUF397 domain-containing protein n=1 Tax=Pseudofrankia inefficax (strain DSM 45817 / CECT 9037 / DDB 130130 / EuI1c) TaxID=298654 RepID=E3JCM9_PSEI1|nr:DUF397 domain-containing protein [Pseudofrankia inefficax]ADP78725.1 protein of unknown function DUF397 [Pseudofrankia inefficax]